MVIALEIEAGASREIVVELDVFSGRPNPAWRLDAAQRIQLLALLRAMDTRGVPPGNPPGLGYRGFTVRIGSGAEARAFHVDAGTVEERGTFYRDDGRAIEAQLIAWMPAEMKEQFKAVLPQLRR